ncbi:hypothetical protein D9758_015325 [Tetrapyrgos nigripes]|uniref:Uncharacterized protein n=1 Tax=Tetrapyrgos nigripes TaxID=182062 RepID=A0A8H5FJH0_9AGAR|nr:hypothetical protein D9758_015325 [Tetrapyrgos nigripes]
MDPTENTLHKDPRLSKQFSLASPKVGLLAEWYKDQAPDSTKINKLEVRSSSGFTMLTHRFVVLHMCGDSGPTHRVDRQADTRRNDAGGLSQSALLPSRAKMDTMDVLHVNLTADDVEDLEKSTLEIEISFNGRVDLLNVISTCYAISDDVDGGKYDLFEHNCFFFSWTILMVSSRVCLQHQTPEKGALLSHFENKEKKELMDYIVKKGVNAFREMVIQATVIFRKQQQADSPNGATIRKGMTYVARMLWAAPRWFHQVVARIMYGGNLHGGLKKTLNDTVDKRLDRSLAEGVYSRVVGHVDIGEELNRHLWVEGVQDVIRPALENGLIDLLWPAIVAVITEGLGTDTNTIGKEVAEDILNKSRVWHIIGRRATQLLAVQSAATHGGMMGVKKEVELHIEQYQKEAKETAATDSTAALKMLNERMFDLAWGGARSGALESAQETAQATGKVMRFTEEQTKARNEMWNAVWTVWDTCWEEVRPLARKKALVAVDDVVEEGLKAIVRLVIKGLKSGTNQPTLPVRILGRIAAKLPFDFISAKSPKDLTILELQEYMQEMMKRAKLGDIDSLQATMARVWDQSRGFETSGVGEKFKRTK